MTQPLTGELGTAETTDDYQGQVMAPLQLAVRTICYALEIEVDVTREQQLSTLNAEQLIDLTKTLAAEQRWPDAL
jgi:hypothetical protein